MQTIRELFEDFLRGRIGYEGDRAFWVLAVSVLIGALLIAVLLVAGPLLCVGVLALVLLALRVRRLALPLLIGAIVVVGWLLLGPLLTIPRFTTEGPVVRNGTAVIVACGKKQGIKGMLAAMKYAHEPATGGWWPEKRGECTIWYHRPPGLEQRFNRHERAH